MLTLEERIKLGDKHFRHLDMTMHISMADMPKKLVPTLELGKDDNIYTTTGLIHIGLNRLEVEDEDEFIATCNYMEGHEEQHIRSTPDKAWMYGNKRGVEVILEELSKKLEKHPRKFMKDSDYEDFANNVLPSLGYKLSFRAIKQVVHHVVNSLEDGRIERIRSIKRPGFQNFMIYYRGKLWQEQELEKYDPKKMSDSQKLTVILNQILSLSTSSIYQKGFTKYFLGSDVESYIKDLMLNIAKGVSAGNCRACMNEGIEICRKLALLIAESSKMKPLDDILSQLMQKIADMVLYGNKNNHEETEDGKGKSPFGKSDIVIEMSEEEYEKLKAQSEDSDETDDSGMRVIVKIKDKTPEDGKEEKNEKGNGNSDKNKDDTSDSDESDGNSEGESSDSKDDDSSSEKSKDNSDKNSDKNSEKSDSLNDENESKPSEPSNKSGNNSIQKETKETEEAIKNAMKDAAEKAEGEIEISKRSSSSRGAKATAEKFDDTKCPDVSEICSAFEELNRNYSVTDRMPPELEGKGNVFKRKMKMFFNNMKSPNVRCKKSGGVDAGYLYKLAVNEMDFFIQKGKTNKFNGCGYILIDNSGSMGYGKDSKRYYANRAAAIIEEGFKNIMPLKIVAFDQNRAVIHEVIKNWNESFHNNCCYNFLKKGRRGGGNADGYSIKIATKELLNKPEEKKILIVLSDGCPTGCSAGETKRAIDDARKEGIEVFGIYFEDGLSDKINPLMGNDELLKNVRGDGKTFIDMYQKNFVLTNPDNISNELIKIMKRFSKN